METLQKLQRRASILFGWLLLVAFASMVPPVWANPCVGSGTLTVSDNGLCQGTGFSDFDTPNHWDVFQGQIIHINSRVSTSARRG